MPALPYVLLAHAYAGETEHHWQSWLAGRLAHLGANADLLTFADPDQPELDYWLAELHEHLDAAPTGVERVVLAHSVGAALWLHHAAARPVAARRVDRVLLVAPPGAGWHEANVREFEPAPVDVVGVRQAAGYTRLVTSDDDPTRSVAEAGELAAVWTSTGTSSRQGVNWAPRAATADGPPSWTGSATTPPRSRPDKPPTPPDGPGSTAAGRDESRRIRPARPPS